MKPTSRQRKTKEPCQKCFLNPVLCLCDMIPRLHLRTRLTLVIHAKELKRTTNTGRLALAALSNSEMNVRGRIGEPLDLAALLLEDYQPLLFYPADEALELNASFVASLTKPAQLIVPDGSWRQAGKIHYRHKELQHVPRVKISDINIATWHLRAEHRPEGMATLEAIAHAFAFLEGAEVGGALMDLYHEKLQRTLIGRGQIAAGSLESTCAFERLNNLIESS